MSTIQIRLTRQQLLDLIVTAFEGGSNYWIAEYVEVSNVRRDKELNYISATFQFTEDISHNVKAGQTAIVNAATMRRGLQMLALSTFPGAKQQLANALSEEGDAITADVVLQMGLFGELIFG